MTGRRFLPHRAMRTSYASFSSTFYSLNYQLPATSPSHGEIYAPSTVDLLHPSSASAASTVSEAVTHLQTSEEVRESARCCLLKLKRLTLRDLDLVDRAPSSSLSDSSCSPVEPLLASSTDPVGLEMVFW